MLFSNFTKIYIFGVYCYICKLIINRNIYQKCCYVRLSIFHFYNHIFVYTYIYINKIYIGSVVVEVVNEKEIDEIVIISLFAFVVLDPLVSLRLSTQRFQYETRPEQLKSR